MGSEMCIRDRFTVVSQLLGPHVSMPLVLPLVSTVHSCLTAPWSSCFNAAGPSFGFYCSQLSHSSLVLMFQCRWSFLWFLLFTVVSQLFGPRVSMPLVLPLVSTVHSCLTAPWLVEESFLFLRMLHSGLNHFPISE